MTMAGVGSLVGVAGMLAYHLLSPPEPDDLRRNQGWVRGEYTLIVAAVGRWRRRNGKVRARLLRMGEPLVGWIVGFIYRGQAWEFPLLFRTRARAKHKLFKWFRERIEKERAEKAARRKERGKS